MSKKHTVMIVDDDTRYLDSVARDFRERNMNLLFAECGESALLRMESNEVDVMVIDNATPGIGGMLLAKEVAKYFPRVVIIMISGALTAAELISAINVSHVSRFFTKPCDMAEVTVAILSALQSKVEAEKTGKSTSAEDYIPTDLG